MKYEEMNISEKELREHTLIKAKDKKKCFICSYRTQYIEFCSEVRICSEECMRKFNQLLVDKLNKETFKTY